MKSLFIPSPCPFFSSEPIWLERNSKELFTLSNPYIVFIWITFRASLGTPQLILGTNPTALLANPHIFAFVLYILGLFLGKILKEIEIFRLSSNWGFCVSGRARVICFGILKQVCCWSEFWLVWRNICSLLQNWKWFEDWLLWFLDLDTLLWLLVRMLWAHSLFLTGRHRLFVQDLGELGFWLMIWWGLRDVTRGDYLLNLLSKLCLLYVCKTSYQLFPL